MLEKLQYKIFHPFFIAVYPVLALLAYNIEEIAPIAALRPLLISIAATAVLLFICKLLFTSWYKAALVTSLVLIFFFSYGHLYNTLKQAGALGTLLGRHRLLAPLWLVIFALAILWVIRSKSGLRSATRALNIIAAILLVFPIFQIGMYGVRTAAAASRLSSSSAKAASLALLAGQPAPDIYYIILDAYSRDDTLAENYQLNNQPFLDQLTRMGFYVARCSKSNFAQTQLSLSSSLNMDYLQNLGDQFKPGNTSRVGTTELIRDNTVRKALESLGYKTVAFETGYKGTQWENATMYLSPAKEGYGGSQVWTGINDFEAILLRTTAGRIFADGAVSLPQFSPENLDHNTRLIHRDRLLFDLEKLPELPAIAGPKLVFAHLVVPHPPYVFGPNGEFEEIDQQDRIAYRDQVIYINKRMLEVLSQIISRSKTPPIIVIQGDHGAIESAPKQRLNILNAYYLPNGGSQNLYPGISPVNTFRYIFDTYFGGHYKLLKDIGYFSAYQTPYEFTAIPEARPGCPAN